MLSLDRRHIINDDLDAFRQVLNGLADGAVWAIESEVYDTLLSNTGSFFSVGNNNLIDDVLSIGGLEAGEIAFGKFTGAGGKPIMADPAILLTGTAQIVTATNLYRQTTLLSVDANGSQIGTENIYQGRYRPVKSKYLDVTGIKKPDGSGISNQSSTVWFLMSEPSIGSAIVVALLNGRAVPTIESSQTDFNTLGMQWRGYHDFGVAQGDEQFAIMSSGDAS